MKHLKTVISFISFLPLAGMLIACEQQGQVITARDVKDEASLRAFVYAAKKHLENDYSKAVEDFRKEGPWKYRSIYLFGIKRDGITIFHVTIPNIETQRMSLIDHDSGEDVIEKMLDAGFRDGGGFVKYKFDNPDIPEKDRSLKISYVVPFRRDGEKDYNYIVGAGFYP